MPIKELSVPSKIAYYFDFVAYPILISMFIGTSFNGWSWLGQALLGTTLFTLTEYWTHRALLHVVMWHSTHQRHHVFPEEYVTFPVWYLPAIFIAFWAVLPVAVFTGFLAGFVWFMYWHHILHHWDLSKTPGWVQRYAKWHDLHHKKTSCNYGITHPGWDWVFGTYRRLGST